jgi:outer membrane lipoprotein SlyB
MMISTSKLLLALLVSASLSSSVSAQSTQNVRIRGTIEKLDGNDLLIKARDGQNVNVKLSDNVRVLAFVKASLEDIRPNSYIGVTAMPQPDGSQRAIAIHIFMESQRGTGEGHRPWDLQPNSTMTNAAVENKVAAVDGQVLTLKYKDGEKKMLITPQTQIVAYADGDRSELKPGTPVNFFAQKQPDGSFTAQAVNFGRGIVPPMWGRQPAATGIH